MKKRIDKRGKREDLEEVMKRNAICRKKMYKNPGDRVSKKGVWRIVMFKIMLWKILSFLFDYSMHIEKPSPSPQVWSVHGGVLNRFSCIKLFATLWTVAHQVPLSM